MKRMTKAQIDEINTLLANHADALTAFYDEGIRYGLHLGYKWTLGGVVIGVAAIGVGEVIEHIRNKRNIEKGS